MNSFNVLTYAAAEEGSMYTHWSENLKMVIQKNGVTIELDEEEIKQLVKSLPRTVSGSY